MGFITSLKKVHIKEPRCPLFVPNRKRVAVTVTLLKPAVHLVSVTEKSEFGFQNN